MDETFYEIFLWWGTGVSHTYHFILKFFTKIVLLRAQTYVENFYESNFHINLPKNIWFLG